MKKLICLLAALTACSTEPAKTPIALIAPVVHPSIQQIERGVIETLEERSPGKYAVTVYNAQGNKSLLRSEIEEVNRKGFALVVTIGTSATEMTAEVFAKKGNPTPIVFSAVNHPSDFKGMNITGVKEEVHFQEEMDAFLEALPALSNVLLVYNPEEAGLKRDAEELQSIFKKEKIRLDVVEVFHTNELKVKVTPHLREKDALIVLKDNTVVSGLDVLSKMCKEHSIALLASDLDSPGRGATLGYGVYERDFGVEAAKKILLILEEGKNPSDIPVTPVADFHLLRGDP
jgi:putative ABC transport system substrate-binding protein